VSTKHYINGSTHAINGKTCLFVPFPGAAGLWVGFYGHPSSGCGKLVF